MMIGRGLFLLTVLSNCVLSLPLTSSQLENDDVQVMKCIVEALADVLSRPRLIPISQECLVTLKTDGRLLTILRHHNFLKELQEIAVGGGQERALLQRLADDPTPTTKALHTTDDNADRSMLDALGDPGERSVPSQRKRARDGRAGKDESREDDTSKEDSETEEVEVERGNDEAEKEEEEGFDSMQANSEEKSEEEKEATDQRGDGSDETRAPSRNKSTERMYKVADGGESNRSVLLSQKHNSKEEEHGRKRGGQEDRRLKKRVIRKEEQEEKMPHHSKVVKEAEEKKKRDAERSPEEKELQMIAQRSPEEKTEMEEEGSGSRKSEEPEIESLAAIESELENVAKKLHGLRRG